MCVCVCVCTYALCLPCGVHILLHLRTVVMKGRNLVLEKKKTVLRHCISLVKHEGHIFPYMNMENIKNSKLIL